MPLSFKSHTIKHTVQCQSTQLIMMKNIFETLNIEGTVIIHQIFGFLSVIVNITELSRKP